jgi:tocopherol cyclase
VGLYKIFHPEIFQGDLKKKNYFEGWFFKHCSKDLKHVISVIPGIALNASDPHAFIQILEGISGQTNYIPYPLETFEWDRRYLKIKVGNSTFSTEGIYLDIVGDAIELHGRLQYHHPVTYPGTILSPGIMCWYSYVPFMECYHGIVSANHGLEGSLNHNGNRLTFSGGNGYVEKDWGTSFPDCWLWVQCNNFPLRDASLFFSVAKIPWLGSYFMGFISFLYLSGKFHSFSTYNKSKLAPIRAEGKSIRIELLNKRYSLYIKVIKSITGELRAPKTGHMSRRIKESNDAVVEVTLSDFSGETVFQETGQRAGFELAGKILEYI